MSITEIIDGGKYRVKVMNALYVVEVDGGPRANQNGVYWFCIECAATGRPRKLKVYLHEFRETVTGS